MSIFHTTILSVIGQAAEHAAGGTGEVAAHTTPHPPELPNFVHLLHSIFPENPVIQTLYQYQDFVFIAILMILLACFFRSATRKMRIIPGRLQAVVEMAVTGLYDLVCGILGEKDGRRCFPFLGSLFIFIICMNLFGLIPLMKSPTSNIVVTAGLAICVFLYVQYNALTRLGPGGYFYHLLGEPKDVIGWCMVPLFLPLHVMEELIKPLSLACRLYGNIYGEDVLLGVGLLLGVSSVAYFWAGTFIGIPLHLPFIFLAMLTSTIQALVFTLLAAVYISMVLPHEHHEEESEH